MDAERACRRIVYARADKFCERCCRNGSLSVHHRVKRSQGGKWTASNCVLVCGSGVTGCHGWIEHHADAAAAEGFHVRPWDDPALIPLWWRSSRWVLLRDDGEMVNV